MTMIGAMRTLDPIETEKIESWLDRVELFLMELQATERAQIILDLNQQVLAQVIANSDLRIEDILKKMGEPIQVANRVRGEKGLKPRQKISRRPTSISRVLIFSVLACFIFMATCTVSLPFVIPWGLNRLAVKFGNQPDGFQSFRFFKNFSFNNTTEKNEDEESEDADNSESNPAVDPSELEKPSGGITQENIKGSFQSEGMNSIRIQAKNAKFIITTSSSSAIQYDCQIANLAFARPFIRKSPSGLVTLAYDQVTESASCEIKIPEQIPLSVQIDSGDVKLKQINQDVQVDAREASLSFAAGDQAVFEIEANTQKGEVKGLSEFEKKQMTLKQTKKHKAIFNLQAGSILFETK